MERVKILKKASTTTNNLASSFRDPSGFVFTHKGSIFRQINKVYKADYELLLKSGLYDNLVGSNLLVSHEEVKTPAPSGDGWKTIKPLPIPLISYPYEWGFGMLKDAALTTLKIQRIAIEHGMSLKDASAFNIQFLNGAPIFIDTLSFEKYEEGKPWIAYKQFVEHFLAPLAIMRYGDVRLGRITSVFLDGIPVDIAATLLPTRARLNLSLLFHIFAHASSQKKYQDKKLNKDLRQRRFSKQALLGLLDNLEGAVKALKWNPAGTQWEDYYEEDKNNYKSASMAHKGQLVEKFVKEIGAKVVWDMGANTGFFSRIAASTGAATYAFDIDFGAVEKAWRAVRDESNPKILPLFSDLTNPTPATGWLNRERLSLFERANADCVLALALIHHLAITNNTPFVSMAEAFANMGRYLVVEYIDKQDSQVQILLNNRKDIFDKYTKADFEASYKQFFTIVHAVAIKDSKRTLYLMKRK